MVTEQKSVSNVEYKTNGTPGEFIADVAIIGNVDRVNDRIRIGAFDDAIKSDFPPPVYYAHDWSIPPIGETVEWEANSKSLQVKSRLFVAGDDAHPYAAMVYAGMKSRDGRPPALREFSFSYGVPDGGAEMVMLDGKAIRDLYTIRPVAEIGPCPMGVNPMTGLVQAPKGVVMETARRALGSSQIKDFMLTSFGAKSWEDVDYWEVGYLLDMLDTASSFIGESDDPGDVAKMQGIAGQLVAMLDAEFAEADAEGSLSKALARGAWTGSRAMYAKAFKLEAPKGTSSDAPLTVTAEIARIETMRPSH